MSYILDTHTLIWLLNGDDKLSKRAIETIENPDDLKIDKHSHYLGDCN